MKDSNKILIHPYSRIVFLLCGCVGTFLSNTLLWLVLFEISILPLIYFSASIKLLGNFLLIVILPMGIMQYCFYTWQNLPDNLYVQEILKIAKLLIYTSVLQIFFVIPLKYVSSTFKAWGFNGEPLLIAIGSYFLWFDVVTKSERVLLARLGSGFIPKRTFLAKIRQIPFILIPVVTGVLKTSVVRSESWKQKDIIKRLDYAIMKKIEYPLMFNLVVIGLSLAWLLINVVKI